MVYRQQEAITRSLVFLKSLLASTRSKDECIFARNHAFACNNTRVHCTIITNKELIVAAKIMIHVNVVLS